MDVRAREARIFGVISAAVVVGVGLAFYVPGFSRAGGGFPVPLDDVYIHFGFARSAALGHPFQWIPGNGYSSGGTSLTYPLLLAPGWLLGFRGTNLCYFAALLACASLWDFARSVRALLAPRLVFFASFVPLLLLSVPLVDWSFYSGMETAVFAAILGRALVSAKRAIEGPAASRVSLQLRAGVWAALVVATRPEALALVLPLGVAITYGARSLPTFSSLARSLGPSAVFLAAQGAANLAFTSELGQAGAVRKLVGTNPYITPIDAAIEVLKNLAVLRAQAFDAALGGAPFSYLAPLLALVAVLSRRTRLFALPLLLGAAGMLLLVSLNTTARYQNLRYAVPSLVMLLVAACLGVSVLLAKKGIFRALGLGLALVLVVAPARFFPRQIDHFARSSANIEGQQAAVARLLAARRPAPRRVFLGDAGAIPYLSGLPALDGLGLGGYHDLPFARASVHGVPAVIELIERLPPQDRPDILAIYDSWWPELSRSFGHKLFSVAIEDNVICGAPEKVVYEADWSTLGSLDENPPGTIDALDVADLVDERAHAYDFAKPQGGWVISAILADSAGRPRFDAGRIIPQGRDEVFTLRPTVMSGRATLLLRTDGGGPLGIRVDVLRDERSILATDIDIPARDEARWAEIKAPLEDVRGGDRIRITAQRSAWRSFHAFVIRPE